MVVFAVYKRFSRFFGAGLEPKRRQGPAVVTAAAALACIAVSGAAVSQTIYVSPSTNDQPGRSLSASIGKARHTSGHTVQLKSGTYLLQNTIELTTEDSGLTLEAAPGARVVLSGSTRVSGWKLADPKRNLWSASLPEGLAPPRQIYINGLRANRTRGRSPVALTMTADGYTASDDTLSKWRHPEDLEFVYTGGNAVWSEPSVGLGSWTEPRCPVAGVHGTEIRMAEPCWKNSTKRVMLPSGVRSANLVGPVSVGKQPTSIENAYELLGRPGEFYFDRSTRTIYYTPRKGEDMARADVEAPRLESLLHIAGTAAMSVHDVTIRGIRFEYAGWQEPSSSEGFSEIQANYRVTGPDGADKQALCTLVPGGTCPFAAWTTEPANVSTRYADRVHFEHDTFTHLGAAGLAIASGAHGNIVQGCIFTDISGNGLELAGVDAPMAPDPDFAVGNRIENNLFRDVGAEFHGGIPIVVGYARDTHIAHNEMDHLPYAAISIGWGGWMDKIGLPGVANRSTGNVIEKNRITRFMLDLSDGGGIYTQGRTGEALADGERVEGNVVDEQWGSGHAIYTDNGSAMITVRNNVMFNTNHDNWGSRHKDYYDGGKGENNDPLAIEGNWWQQGDPDSSAKQVTESGNHLINTLNEAPAELLSQAGLEPAFRDIAARRTPVVAPAPPTAVGAFISGSDAYVSWRVPVFDGGSAITGYTVRSDDGKQTTVSAQDYDRQAYVKLPLTESTATRRFIVTASNAAGASPDSLPSFPVTAPAEPAKAPGPPQSVSVRLQGTRASIHFGAPKERESHVLAYVVHVDPDNRAETFTGRRLITLEGTHVTFVTLDGLTPGKHYRFGVAAVNPAGEGETVWAEERSEAH